MKSQTLLLILLSATLSRAETINLASQGTAADPNERTALGPTLVIPKHPAWYGPLPGSSWVSYVFQSGDPAAPNYVAPPNTAPNAPGVAFFEEFFIPGQPLSGTLTVLADDSASVWLNGILLQPEAPIAGNAYSYCSDFPIGCRATTAVTLDLAPALQNGPNTLVFNVAQRAGVSYGLDYAGTVDFAPTPEPATLLLLTLPAVALCFRRRAGRA